MRTTTKNYFKAVSEVGFDNLPEVLKKSHLLIEDRTNKGSDWGIYENDAEVKRVFDLSFEKLDEFIDKNEDLSGTENTDTKETMKQESTLTEKFVKRFLLLNGKTLQKKEIEGFLNDVQTAIKEKEITKDSVLSKEVLLIQSKLLTTVNNMGRSIKVELAADTKRKLQLALNKLKAKPAPSKPKKNNLNGVEEIQEVKPKQNLMNSIDFVNLHFNSIGFSGKWLNLIGDPSPGFTAMVFGRPKMGKSYLCVDFAGYLARNHGTVLYVANEEKLDATLQMKLNDTDVKHENLFVSDYLPEDLSMYQFIILDSVNKLGLNPKDLENLKKNNPGKSFLFIFQTTKDGKFKGANSYQHDVDVVIEIPEKGKATQFGRFNAGGEMNIFEDTPNELSGVKKSIKPIRKIEIETELGLPLEELAIEFLNKKEPREKIVEILDHDAESIYAKLIKMLTANIKGEGARVEIKEVEFTEMDSDNLNHGAAYFKVKLEGSKKELEKIAGDDMYFVYDWEDGVAGVRKSRKNLEVSKKVSNVATMEKKSNKPEDWTEPAHFNSSDKRDLKLVKKYYDEGNFKQAMNYASRLETIVREEIPPQVWQDIGGELTPKGKERLMSKDYESRADDINPRFIFSTTATALLVEALRGDFDLKQLIRRELANRGLNTEGNWVGFDKAAQIHKIKK